MVRTKEEMYPIVQQITNDLFIANRSEELEELLVNMGYSYLLKTDNDKITFDTDKDGIILVIGESFIKKEILLSVAKTLGLNKNRFEFCLDYKDAANYNFGKLQYNPQYRLILFGPIPHSTKDKEDNSSIINRLESEEGFPKTIRLCANSQIKITKENFKNALIKEIEQSYI